jgi:hypothetical protein
VDGDLVVFCCVDTIAARRMLWESLRGEVMRVLASPVPAIDDDYGRTLFPAEEAHSGPCTARSTIYTASIAAGLMVHQFAKWLRGVPIHRDLTLNMLAAEQIVGTSA